MQEMHNDSPFAMLLPVLRELCNGDVVVIQFYGRLNMGHTGRQPVNPLSLVFFNIEK
jgi:hypothetical protein